MHAELSDRQTAINDRDLWLSLWLALGVHALLVLVLLLASWFSSWERPAAAGTPAIEASLVVSDADIRAAQSAMRDAPKPEPMPEPIQEPVPEETVPPPQPIPEPRPQDAATPQQSVAQERMPVPDKVDQDAASRMAISQEKALKEQEAKRRQEQIDLTERQRQESAEQKLRLAKQQQEEAERKKKLTEIQRAKLQAAKAGDMAELKLRQLADVRARNAASTTAATPATAGSAGQSGVDPNLLGKYIAAIQAAVASQWTRPESVPLGTRCRVIIKQAVGGEVLSAEVQPGCPMDQVGQDSLERAVLKAQPLPYRGFESVFNRTLNFNFTVQDH